MGSPFIEKSKHAEMTAAVENHFGTSSARTMPGSASGKGFNRGGDQQYNSVPLQGWESSDGGGVNYTPDSQAGHTVGGLPAGVKSNNTA
jgi:hypothetical protein